MNMIKTVEIVSLSSGVIGEPFAAHELKIGVERLEAMGLSVKFSPHALKGLQYIKDHPEARAADLVEAFSDPDVDMILCAIGGDDTYRLLPYLFDNDELKKIVSNDKVFLGFSDTTINHLMLHKLGIKTFYGQSFLADLCELDSDMLPYSKEYFEELIQAGKIKEIRPSDETHAEEYKKMLVSVVDDPSLPILFNMNIGHATPRCIIPFGVNAMVDANEQVIRFE